MTNATTPMMQQYEGMRARLPENTLLLFRLGDFYELFGEDAHVGSKILGITLTSRHGVPMAGIPYHAAENYIDKVLSAGKKVAICEQLEAPTPGKLVSRSLTRILSPGTLLEDKQIQANRNNSILAVTVHKNRLSLAALDITTGDFQIATHDDFSKLLPFMYALDPKEILIPQKLLDTLNHKPEWASWTKPFFALCQNRVVTELEAHYFDVIYGAKLVIKILNLLTVEGFGIPNNHYGLGPAGAVLEYATQNLCTPPKNIKSIREYKPSEYLLIDPSTLRNLEIFKTTTQERKGSLIDAMDHCVSAAGGRLLEHYIIHPSQSLEEIHYRQSCVGIFVKEPTIAQKTQELLSYTKDLLRIIGRLQNNVRNPRELGGLRDTIYQIPFIIEQLRKIQDNKLNPLKSNIQPFDALHYTLKDALSDNLPNNLLEGGYIRDAYKAELDELRMMSSNHKQWLAQLEKTEQENSGIKNLKIKYNGAYGYFIEITKSNLHLVPDHYKRKQTLTQAERFYTDELKQKEKEILYAEEKAIALEEVLFKELVAKVLEQSESLKATAQALAQLDVFLGWAYLARQWNYTCPIVDGSDTIFIEDGRHPVIEQILKEDRLTGSRRFTPNNTNLSSSRDQIMLITGPNMAGKSTYIRQVALITLMAHTGAWVPAKSCRIGLVDRIFSRIGASDELAKGNSTFMVEMNETANILNNTTARSLIILDEIGRGTSTYDGLSIAWSVLEYLHGCHSQGPKTLFATHYHELTQLEKTLSRLKNYWVLVKEYNQEIIFLHQVLLGSADRSYGIHVARLAGLPEQVINRANIILSALEGNTYSSNETAESIKPLKKPIIKESINDEGQLVLF